MSRRKKLLFSIGLLVGTLGLVEAAASVLYYLGVPERERGVVELSLDLTRTDNNVLRYTPHPYFNFVSNPAFQFSNGHRPHNAMGLRGPACCQGDKSPELIRVVALGGSTTYGMYFSFERNVWPALLEEQLRKDFGDALEVINAGVPYYTTYEMLGMLAMRVPEFSPDIVLIHAGLNDAFTVGFPDEGGPDNRRFRHAFNYRPLPAWLKTSMRGSYVVRLLGMTFGSREGYVPGDMATTIQYAVPPDDEVKRHAQKATGKYFRRNLSTLVALAKHIGAVPVLVNMPLNPKFETGQSVYHTAVAKAVQRNNHIAKRLAEQNGVLYVDLYSRMRDPGLFLDAGHVNRAGMRMKAHSVAKGLAPLITELAKSRPSTRSKRS